MAHLSVKQPRMEVATMLDRAGIDISLKEFCCADEQRMRCLQGRSEVKCVCVCFRMEAVTVCLVYMLMGIIQ